MIKTKRALHLLIMILPLLPGCGSSQLTYHLNNNGKRVVTGLEVFLRDYAKKYAGKKAILITNHSGVNFRLEQNLGLLRREKIAITLILAPEHGLYGYRNLYDENLYRDETRRNLVIYNLHKLDASSLRFLLKSVDIVLFDIQDMGMRCYTYISNLKHVMDAINNTGTQLIVLDRPNPVSFLGIDGAYLDTHFRTRFVSAFPAPFLYGMTIGESANYYKNRYAKDVKLRVVKMEHYNDNMRYDETGLPWIPPSPNLPTYESSILYTAVVLMEGINISLGRGTTKPFEFIGAPWIEPFSFSEKLSRLGLKNFRFRPVYFKPTFSIHEGTTCGGVQIFYTGGRFSPTEFSYRVIKLLFNEYRETEWEKYKQWYSADHLAGTDIFRKSIDKKLPYEKFAEMIKGPVERYKNIMEEFKIY